MIYCKLTPTGVSAALTGYRAPLGIQNKHFNNFFILQFLAPDFLHKLYDSQTLCNQYCIHLNVVEYTRLGNPLPTKFLFPNLSISLESSPKCL